MGRSLLLPVILSIFFGASPLRCAEPDTFEVRVEGSGPPLVLIPGLSCTGAVWNSTVAHLKAKFTCHIISIRGFGGTAVLSPLPSPFLTKVRDEIIVYIGEKNLGHPVIVGHSLGGFLALTIGIAAPDLPKGLVIVDSAPFLAAQVNPDVKQETADVIAEGIRKQAEAAKAESFAAAATKIVNSMVQSPDEAATIAEMVNRSDQHTVMEAGAELFRTDLRADLAKITCPVLVICALGDKAVFAPPEEFEKRIRQQYAALTQAQFVFLPEARHFVMYDDPKGFFRALDSALAGKTP